MHCAERSDDPRADTAVRIRVGMVLSMTDRPEHRRTRPPTVTEVARLAGVSPMTVSRTFAGGTHVRAELQARVLEAARTLGYHRNENARSIRPGQASGLIGVAITNLANPYYGEFALGVEEVAARSGRRILLGNSDEDPARERQLVEDFVGRQVEGLVVVPSGTASSLGHEVLGRVPVVFASRLVEDRSADAVLVDDVGGAFRGTVSAIDAGHRRIGYLGNEQSVFTGRRRFEGFVRAHEEHGLAVDPALVRRRQQDVTAAADALDALLDLPEPPTAVFCANNRNAIGALTAIGRRLQAGTDAHDLPSIVSFDRFELAGLMPVPVTIVDHDPRALGAAAAQLLLDRLDGLESAGPRVVTIPATVSIARD
jgi:LacI family transcriptional regulator